MLRPPPARPGSARWAHAGYGVAQIELGPALLSRLQSSRVLPTGTAGVDRLLGGGLRETHVVEVCGPPGAGKTALCLGAAAETASRGERVLWLDAGGGFAAPRLLQILRRMGLARDAAEKAMAFVEVARTPDLEGCLAALVRAEFGGRDAEHREGPYRLVVLDGVHLCARSLSGGAGGLGPQRASASLRALGDALSRVASAFPAPCLVTNGDVEPLGAWAARETCAAGRVVGGGRVSGGVASEEADALSAFSGREAVQGPGVATSLRASMSRPSCVAGAPPSLSTAWRGVPHDRLSLRPFPAPPPSEGPASPPPGADPVALALAAEWAVVTPGAPQRGVARLVRATAVATHGGSDRSRRIGAAGDGGGAGDGGVETEYVLALPGVSDPSG